MVSLSEVERQLKQIGASFRFFGRAEIVELQHILIPGEEIKSCINGHYSGGFATLCATDQRLLLIDKKPMYLTLEDVRYDMVAEVDFSHRLLDATVHVVTPTKTMRFITWRGTDLRKMTTYMQQRVLEIRQHQTFQPQVEQQFIQQQLQPASAVAAAQMPVPTPVPTAVPAPAASQIPIVPLPMPSFINPYTTAPLLMRRRVSRWGSTRPQ